MNINRIFGENTRGVVLAILTVIILFPIGYSIISFVFAQTSPNAELFLEMPDSTYTECVKDTDYMRFHHWELLQSVRSEVVRFGIRGDISLSGCRKCHTSREQFCNKCHNAVSLYPDCFSCHYYP
ncbi:MAG: hypothetical protein HN356_15035 [Calditrichaeota bacterium]|nr:hypothetical protein [Calditrichota bacterium]MBT7617352.1 hypothetical protein [Calditrichota bacterium]